MNNTIQELYEKYYSAVYRYFSKNTYQDNAEDLAQQTFLKLITYISCIDKISSPKALVFTVAKSVLSDYYRNKKMLDLAISFDELYDYTDNYDFTNEIESTDFLNKLTKRERHIVDLKIQGYKSKEIGEIIGVSGSTVRTYMEKIRKKLM